MARNGGTIDEIMGNIHKAKESLYSDIYYNKNTSNRQINSIKNKLDASIQKISNNNMTNTGLSNISVLYNKTLDTAEKKNADFMNNLSAVLSDKTLMDNIMSVYTQNTWVRNIDMEIDMVCKYMPKLEEALETRKEHVLSADHFNKDPIIIQSVNANNVDIDDDPTQANIDTLEKKYNLCDLMDRIYDDTDKRGEAFVYIVPYKKAIAELLRNQQDSNTLDGVALRSNLEETIFSENGNLDIDTRDVVQESVDELKSIAKEKKFSSKKEEFEKSLLEDASKIKFSINKTGIIKSAIRDAYKARRFFSETGSLFFTEDETLDPDKVGKEYDGVKTDPNSMSADGVTLDNAPRKNEDIKVPGCVVKILDHTMVKPLYIDNICLGYFYIECDKQIGLEQTTFSSTIGGIRPGGFNKDSHDPYASYGNEYIVLKNLAAKISEKIDAKFVNANQDLSKEIYYILKYNTTVDATGKISKIDITFIPPEDMEHCYFDFDNDTKRGISGLYKSLFPAKLFSCMYIANVIQILTRGNDKRVYYVKQSVDTNIMGVLSNVIQQIQMGNFGIRQIDSMQNVLNQIGQFNDYVIPRSSSGDSPIEFEVIPGQNIEPKTELMNMLEEMAVNATDVPIEVITSRQQVDYATHLTMTNTKFLQKIYNRQGKAQKIFSRIITRIYNYEYNMGTANKNEIKVVLPPPIYLNAVNSAQIIDSVGTMCDNLSNICTNDDGKGTREEFARLMKLETINTLIPKEIIKRVMDKAEMNIAKNSNDGSSEGM